MKGKMSHPPNSLSMLIYLPALGCAPQHTCFMEEGQIAAFGSVSTREKACDSAILQHHQEGSSLQSPEIQDPWPPGSQSKCGSKWAVVGRDIRDATSAPPPRQNRTKWDWKCGVLHAATRHFQLIWAGLLAPLEVLPVSVFPLCEFLWWKLFPKLKILSEIGKTSVESVSGASVGGQPPWKACSSKPEKENGPCDSVKSKQFEPQ